MAERVTVVNGIAYYEETGQPVGYRPGELRSEPETLPAPIGVGKERWAALTTEQIRKVQRLQTIERRGVRTAADVLIKARAIYGERPTPKQIRGIALESEQARKVEALVSLIKPTVKTPTTEIDKQYPKGYLPSQLGKISQIYHKVKERLKELIKVAKEPRAIGRELTPEEVAFFKKPSDVYYTRKERLAALEKVRAYRKEHKEFYEKQPLHLRLPARYTAPFLFGPAEFALEHPALTTAAFFTPPSILKGIGVIAGGVGLYEAKKELPLIKELPTAERPGAYAELSGETTFSALMMLPGIRAGWRKVFGKKPITEIPSAELQRLVEKFSRKRATLMLKTKEGKYILGQTRSGQYISVGGGIKKGQSPRAAVLKELLQETGLTLKDIKNLKFVKKFVTPEETFYTFTATVKDISKIRPSSDIARGIKTVSPSKAREFFGLGPDITGMTPKYPISKHGIRSYELGIITYLETGKLPTWMKVETRVGPYYFGTQSRYDVPWKVQRQYLEQQKLLLAHGTVDPRLVRTVAPWEKGMPIEVAKGKRGIPGLYLQPPVYAGGRTEIYTGTRFKPGKWVKIKTPFKTYVPPEAPGYIGLSYMGYGPTPMERLGIKLGVEKPTAYLLREAPKAPIVPTAKAIRGIEAELLAQVGAYVKTVGRAEKVVIGGKTTYLQQIKLVKDVEKAGRINRLLAALKKDISLAKKNQILSTLKKETGIDYSSTVGRYTYVSPEKIVSRIAPLGVSIKKIREVKEEKLPISEYKIIGIDYSKVISYERPRVSYKPTPPYKPPKALYKLKVPPYIPKPVYKPTRVPYKPKVPYKPPTPPYIPPPVIIERKLPTKEIRRILKKIKKAQAYQAFAKVKGEWIAIGKPALKQVAIKAGEVFVGKESLAATLKVLPTGKYIKGLERPYVPSPIEFRPYKIRKGLKIPLEMAWIERRRFRLERVGREVQLIQQAKADTFRFGKQVKGITKQKGGNVFFK